MLLKNIDGYKSQNAQNYLDGSTLHVYSADGEQLGTTTLNSNTFTFQNVYVEKNQGCFFEMTLPNGREVGVETYGDVTLSPGKKQNIELYINKNWTPDGTIVMSGTTNSSIVAYAMSVEESTVYSSIQELRVDVEEDMFPIEVTWQIGCSCAGIPDINVTGEQVSVEQLERINQLQGEASYNVRCTLTDITGNSTTLGMNFRMFVA